MQTLAAGVSFVDLHFQGRARVIACAILHDGGGVALVDPGPSSTLPALRQQLLRSGIGVSDITAILLTHIHLDHAGATGALVRENPRIRVYVHESGARHMVDPSKLIASAARLYGDAMERLWGEFAPVPAAALAMLAGGERVTAGGRVLDVAYTPGHASHHVSFFSADTGVAFVGDTAGVQIIPGGYVLPPTPPPDIDLELWVRSLETIGKWRADTLFLTHFGPAAPPGHHLTALGAHLAAAAQLASESLSVEGGEQVQEAWFVERVRAELRRTLGDADAVAYEAACRFDLNWLGLARYWKKRSA
jgi:glyoxylase-like metal-dependent hydrolase (beta-lactamase superfamily II)